MRFNRRLQPFQALSFDLDDTLYSNHPIMLTTNASMIDYFKSELQNYHVVVDNYRFDFKFWFAFRQQALQQNPTLKHDVGLLRLHSYRLGALSLGLSVPAAEQFSNAALSHFTQLRSDFSLPQRMHDFLGYLQTKLPLVAITNGNVDTKRIGIASYFSHHFNATIDNRQKPDADMFNKACRALNILPQQLLHVGDCGRSDIFGGIQAGCQTVWLNRYHVGKPLTVLPTLELDDIYQLRHMVT
jgi:putative hydrolase of the HAD superfamily